MKQLFAFFILIVTLSINLVSCGGKDEKVYEGYALGTSYYIRIQGQGEPLSQADIERLINKINSSLSTYRENSLISRVNHGETLTADEYFRDVYKQALKIYKETGGIFDPTVGILVNAWGFGPEQKMENIEQDSSLVDSLLQFVGFSKVKITSGGVIKKDNPSIFIDFNSIAKGYVIDKIGALLRSKGYYNFVVELGGEVLASGKNILEDRVWEIAVESPLDEEKNILVVNLKNEAIATSGNYRKFRVDPITGKKYVHTINPLTGYPVQSNLLSASVIAPTCMEADGWATACMAGGFERAKKWIEKHKRLKGILIFSDSTHQIRIWHSPDLNIKKIKQQNNE